MANKNLYPPTLDDTAPAFNYLTNCRIYFSLSNFSTASIRGVHISVIKQTNGQSVVNKDRDSGNTVRYRETGIIITNETPIKVEDKDNLYYIEIRPNDIINGNSVGWELGWNYKVQLRFSERVYDGSEKQSVWLNRYSNSFSEWSNACIIRATGNSSIIVSGIDEIFSNIKTDSNVTSKINSFSFSTYVFDASYENEDLLEVLYSYRLKLYSDNVLLEDSGIIYSNKYLSPNKMHYNFKTELKNESIYKVEFSILTINGLSETYDFDFDISYIHSGDITVQVVSLENLGTVTNTDFKNTFLQETFLGMEEDEGRVALKLFSDNADAYNGNLCIRRADSKDNFQTWTDIKMIVCSNTMINSLPMFYDNTIESGVFYKYGIQNIGTQGERDVLIKQSNPILRDFEYSFLVGEGGRQLALRFNNSMNNFKYNYSEGKNDTIGGEYPFITRIGNKKYKSFPVNGLISFNMDENHLFTSDEEIYQYSEVLDAYAQRRRKLNNQIYDYKKEFDFREKVLNFLQDGKPKLFKSPTEGNIIIRLMNVSPQPENSLNRMIYSFNAEAYEIDAPTLANYSKYKFFTVGDYATSFEKTETKIGQLDIDIEVPTARNINVENNIIKKIWEKYDLSNRNINGKRYSLSNISHLSIEFSDPPLAVDSNMLGNSFTYNGDTIFVSATASRKYVFDESIKFYNTDTILINGANNPNDSGNGTKIYDANGNETNKIHITVNFLYDIMSTPYQTKVVKSTTNYRGLGQLCDNYVGNTSLYKFISYKYYEEKALTFRRLNNLIWTCLEAEPGAVFRIMDNVDNKFTDVSEMQHEIGYTGILNFEGLGNVKDIVYLGMRRPDGTIDEKAPCDIIVDYIYYACKGTYREVF